LKHLILIYLVIFVSGITYSQNIDYFDNNPEWRVDHSIFGDCIDESRRVYYIRNYRFFTPFNASSCGDPIYTEEFVDLIRQDEKKVYLLFENSDTLLYDFSLEVGDTIPDTFHFINSLDFPVTVESIDSL